MVSNTSSKGMVKLYVISAGSGGAAGAGLGGGVTGWGGWAAISAALAGAAAAEESGLAAGAVVTAGETLFVEGNGLGRDGMGLPGCGRPGTGGLVCAAASSGRAMSKDKEKTFLRFIMFSWVHSHGRGFLLVNVLFLDRCAWSPVGQGWPVGLAPRRRPGASARRSREGGQAWGRGRCFFRRRRSDIGGSGGRAGSLGNGRWSLGRRLGEDGRFGQGCVGHDCLLVISDQGEGSGEFKALRRLVWVQLQFPDPNHGGIIAHIIEELHQSVFRRLGCDPDGLALKEFVRLAG